MDWDAARRNGVRVVDADVCMYVAPGTRTGEGRDGGVGRPRAACADGTGSDVCTYAVVKEGGREGGKAGRACVRRRPATGRVWKAAVRGEGREAAWADRDSEVRTWMGGCAHARRRVGAN